MSFGRCGPRPERGHPIGIVSPEFWCPRNFVSPEFSKSFSRPVLTFPAAGRLFAIWGLFMRIWSIGLVICACLLGAAGAAARDHRVRLSTDWKQLPIPVVVTADGERLTFDSPLGVLAEGVRPQRFAIPEAVVGAMGQRGLCRHKIDVQSLADGASKILRNRHLSVYRFEGENTVVIQTTPTKTEGRAEFYRYYAELKGCAAGCELNVATYRVSAPVRDSVIHMNEATNEDDDITGSLFDASEAVFRKCRI